jgi:hypothetical protein
VRGADTLPPCSSRLPPVRALPHQPQPTAAGSQQFSQQLLCCGGADRRLKRRLAKTGPTGREQAPGPRTERTGGRYSSSFSSLLVARVLPEGVGGLGAHPRNSHNTRRAKSFPDSGLRTTLAISAKSHNGEARGKEIFDIGAERKPGLPHSRHRDVNRGEVSVGGSVYAPSDSHTAQSTGVSADACGRVAKDIRRRCFSSSPRTAGDALAPPECRGMVRRGARSWDKITSNVEPY